MTWDEALAAFDRDMRARSLAERTRKAYGVDLGRFVEWAKARGLEPAGVRHRDVRRYGAGSRPGGAAAATVARKLASVRGLFDFLVRSERVGQNPADLVSSPKRDEKLPRVLSAEQMRALLERIPARTPLQLRDRAMLELAYSCGLALRGDRQPRPRLLRLRDRAAAGARQGLQGAAAAGRRAGPARPAPLPGQGPPRARRRPARARRSSSPRAAAASRAPTSPAASASGSARRRSPRASRRTRCATASPPTCSKAAPTCARSRSCSATRRSRRRRSTLVSTPLACGRRTLQPIRVHDGSLPKPRPVSHRIERIPWKPA